MIVVALALLAVAGAGFAYRLVVGPNLSDRIVSADGLLTIVVMSMIAWSAFTDRTTFLIVGVVVALVGFLGTSVLARFVEGRR